MTAAELPQFFEVDGLPVSLGPVPGCSLSPAQWSSGRPERYRGRCIEQVGKRLSEAAWRDLITANVLGW